MQPGGLGCEELYPSHDTRHGPGHGLQRGYDNTIYTVGFSGSMSPALRAPLPRSTLSKTQLLPLLTSTRLASPPEPQSYL